MSNEIAKPLTAAEMAEELRHKVQEKVRASFVDLVDAEQWAAMTKAALEEFTNPSIIKSSYGPDTYGPSPLEKIIEKEVHKKFREWLKAELQKPGWETYGYGIYGLPETSDNVKELVKELMPEIVASAFGSFMQTTIERMRQILGTVP